jgi:hypothetical protein
MSARREERGRHGPRAARARGGKSKALPAVAETGTGRGGGAACYARVFLGHHLVCGVCVTRMQPCLLTPPR